MVMTVIKVTVGGCGIKYTDSNGMERHELKKPEDGPFECEIEQAKRLVDLGVAEYVSPWIAPSDDEDDGAAGDVPKIGHLSFSYAQIADNNTSTEDEQPTNERGTELFSLSFTTTLHSGAGVDVRAEI